MPVRGTADARQGAREPEHLVELLLIAPQAPLFVVQVLPPARRIRAHCLDVAEGIRADPYVLPRRRDDELPDAPEHFLVPDALAVSGEVLEAAPAPPAGDPRA